MLKLVGALPVNFGLKVHLLSLHDLMERGLPPRGGVQLLHGALEVRRFLTGSASSSPGRGVAPAAAARPGEGEGGSVAAQLLEGLNLTLQPDVELIAEDTAVDLEA